MGEGLNIPIPIFRWSSWAWARAHLNGLHFSPQVWVTFEHRGVARLIAMTKLLLLLFYLTWQLYLHKGYLERAGIQGTARIQMQHPVQNCNPLHPGCKANFRDWDALPYCKQHVPQTNETIVGRRETCQYMDEFDLIVPASDQHNLLIPTRRTLYQQNVLCSGREQACEKKYEVVNEEVSYIADIESFTLLIDHSVECSELKLDKNSWEMVGLYQPDEANEHSSLFDENPVLWPIRTRFGKQVGDPAPPEQPEHKAFSMWMERNWFYTFFPFFESTAEMDKVNAPFYKIPNGDVISVGALLKELDVNLDEPMTEGNDGKEIHTRRHDGMVLVISITYKNYKFFTWPNRLPPVYIYKFEVVPASEYKIMIDHEPVARQIGSTDFTGLREVDDRHGILVVVQQCGEFGVWSIAELFLMFLGLMMIEALLLWCIEMVFLNCIRDGKRFEDLLITNIEVGNGVGEAGERSSTPSSASESDTEPLAQSVGLTSTSVRRISAEEDIRPFP